MFCIHTRSRAAGAIALMLVFAITACGDEDPTGPETTTGALEVSVATTGDDVDSDGYTVTVGDESASVPADGSATFASLEPGTHTAELSGIAANCSLSGENPRSVTVSEGDTAQVSLAVSCAARQGGLAVTSATSGDDVDSDGYTLLVDGSEVDSLAVDGQVTLGGLSEGDHTVELRDVAVNCSVSGENPRTVTVAYGDTASVSFDAACEHNQIVFASDRDGDNDIYVMNADGSWFTRLTESDSTDNYPVWSPDGSKIAFASNRDGNYDIYVMNADGTGVQPVTRDTARDLLPTWSPDGSTIAFASNRDGDYDIYTIAVDGTGLENVTRSDADAAWAAWSPDGSTIAFMVIQGSDYDISTIAPDGTGRVAVLQDTATSDGVPGWSPDGSRLVFQSDRSGDWNIYTVNADGGAVTQVTSDAAADETPKWSPDGARIAFTSRRDGDYDLYITDADGGDAVQLTDIAGWDSYPHWKPFR